METLTKVAFFFLVLAAGMSVLEVSKDLVALFGTIGATLFFISEMQNKYMRLSLISAALSLSSGAVALLDGSLILASILLLLSIGILLYESFRLMRPVRTAIRQILEE